jgi:hypothetical protein
VHLAILETRSNNRLKFSQTTAGGVPHTPTTHSNTNMWALTDRHSYLITTATRTNLVNKKHGGSCGANPKKHRDGGKTGVMGRPSDSVFHRSSGFHEVMAAK